MLMRLPPIQISTKEAFEEILTTDAPALYITAAVYLELYETLRQQLQNCGYEEWMVCRRGVIFVKTRGAHPFDSVRHRIFLPLEGLE